MEEEANLEESSSGTLLEEHDAEFSQLAHELARVRKALQEVEKAEKYAQGSAGADVATTGDIWTSDEDYPLILPDHENRESVHRGRLELALEDCIWKGKKAGEWEKALELLAETKANGIEPTFDMYFAIIMTCQQAGEYRMPRELLQEMEAKGIEPDQAIYNSAIRACKKNSKCGPAIKLLREMEKKGIEPNAHMYYAIIWMCNKQGRWQLAQRLLQELKAKGIRPNTIIYNATIRAHAKEGKWEKAHELLQEMEANGIEQDEHTYNAVMKTYEKHGHWDKVLELLRHMKTKGVKPDTTTFNTSFRVCKKAGKWEKALQLQQVMHGQRSVEQQKKQQQEQENQFYEIRRRPAKKIAGDEAAGEDKVHRRPHIGAKHTSISYAALISTFEKGGEWEKALEVLAEMQANLPLYNDSDVWYSKETHIAVIAACAMGGNWEKARELQEEMRAVEQVRLQEALEQLLSDEEELQQDTKSYNSILCFCENGGEWERALALLAHMQAQGFKPDTKTFNTVVRICKKQGEWEKAREVLREMRAKGIKVETYLDGLYGKHLDFKPYVGGGQRRNKNVRRVRSTENLKKLLRKQRTWEDALELLRQMELKGIVPHEG
jgi:pentatricopeptide repeat protein